MNILFVPMRDPRFSFVGTEQRTHLLWNNLKRQGRVFTFLLDEQATTEGEMTEGEHPIYKFKPVNKTIVFYRKINNLLRRLTFFKYNLGKNLAFPDPQKVFGGIRFDLVVVRYISPLCLFDYWRLAPLVIDIDDYPVQVFETWHSHKLSFPMRQLGRFLTRFMTRSIINKSTGGWVSNEEQVNLCGANYYFLPNIPNLPSSSYIENYSERKNLFTVGYMGYTPNYGGVSRFLKEIWPHFHKKYPDVKYFIVGADAPEDNRTTWNNTEGVEYLGCVDNLEPLYQKVLATVVPVYSGGGTCIKTLESMAYSRFCLSTPFGARGLPKDVIANQKGIAIFDTADDFINSYDAILNTIFRAEKEQQGRQVIDAHYSRERVCNVVDKVLKRVSKTL